MTWLLALTINSLISALAFSDVISIFPRLPRASVADKFLVTCWVLGAGRLALPSIFVAYETVCRGLLNLKIQWYSLG